MALDFSDLSARIAAIEPRAVTIEAAVVALCVVVAWGVCRWFGRDQPKDSIWFGRNILDGLSFPLLALLLIDLSGRALAGYQTLFLLPMAVSVFISLVAIRFFARVLQVVFPDSALARLLERTVSWVAWIGAILWIVGLLPPVLAELDEITLAFGRDRVSLRTVLGGVISAAAVLVIALWVSATIERRILSEAVTDLSMRKVASNAVRSVLLLVGLLFALSAVGVDLTALSVLGGALGVGLGFGLQKLAANYVSGFVILLERAIRIGDNVKVDNFEGKVTDIKVRYTLVRATNGREAIVPNESLITGRVENLTQADRKFNVQTTIGVGYDSDVDQVQSILCAAAAAQPRVLQEPAPVAFLLDFGPSALQFTLNFWITDPDKGRDNLRSTINLAILKGLREAGVSIPYPQSVLHVESLPAIASTDAARL